MILVFEILETQGKTEDHICLQLPAVLGGQKIGRITELHSRLLLACYNLSEYYGM